MSERTFRSFLLQCGSLVALRRQCRLLRDPGSPPDTRTTLETMGTRASLAPPRGRRMTACFPLHYGRGAHRCFFPFGEAPYCRSTWLEVPFRPTSRRSVRILLLQCSPLNFSFCLCSSSRARLLRGLSDDSWSSPPSSCYDSSS